MAEKVNITKYFLYCLILVALSYFVVHSVTELYVVILVVMATSVNHWMLIHIIRQLSQQAAGGHIKNKKWLPLLIIAKLFLVVGALTFGVQIMGKRILIPLLIYVLQIVVLYLSFEKKPNVE